MVFEAGEAPRHEVQPESDFSTARFAGSDPAVDDVVIGGAVSVNEAGRTLLLESLPPVAHIRSSAAGDGDRLLTAVLRLFDEATDDRPGSAFAIRQYSQLLLLEVLRCYVDQTLLPSGWLRLLVDERLRPAVDLLHGRPEHAWGLEELARAAAMSRTTFVEQFREAAGVPPLTYLGRWRMLLAQLGGERVQHGVQARYRGVAAAVPRACAPRGRSVPGPVTEISPKGLPTAAGCANGPRDGSPHARNHTPAAVTDGPSAAVEFGMKKNNPRAEGPDDLVFGSQFARAAGSTDSGPKRRRARSAAASTARARASPGSKESWW